MFPNLNPWLTLFSAFVVALVVCNRMTPPVKRFAERIGAMDIPKDNRRVHDHPIPRLGGLAIFLGYEYYIYAVMHFTSSWHLALRLVLNTLLIVGFVAYIVHHDFPLRSLPVVGRFFRK